jgi:alkanesulfonate monooxygenase SsuD/methylene tetrahydromethanopterin reductase-like flavin-dependent oxidoreductase (luciferase family)
MEFGIFDSLDLGLGGAGEVLHNHLRFAVEAERLDVGRYHVTEHHGTPLSVSPSPNIFLAALGQRTTTLRIGALVNVLPAYDLFRLAEEIGTLDQLCGGRLDLGVGSGVSPYELAILGIEAAELKPIYGEALPALTEALRTGSMRHEGTLLRSYDAELSVLPVQRPYPPLWYASSNTATAGWAGRQAVNFVGRWNNGAITPAVRTYRNAWEDHRGDEGRLNAHVDRPCVGLAARVVIAPTDEQAHDIFARANALFCERVTHLWHRNGNTSADIAFASMTVLANGTACVGSAASVRDQLADQVEASGVNYLELSAFFGDMTYAEAMSSLGAFAETVAPALQSVASATWVS